MNLQEASDALAKDASWVGKLLKLLKLLDFPTRQLISENFRKNDGYDLPESHAHCLEDLATGGPQDQAQIAAAFKVVLERRMSYDLVKKLVEWVKKGNSPESFPQDGKVEVKKGVKNQRFDPNDPKADLWKALPRNIQVHQTPKGYKAVWTLGKGEAALALYSGLHALEEAKRLQDQPNDPRFGKEIPRLLLEARKGIAQNAPGGPALVEVKSLSDLKTGLLGLGARIKGIWKLFASKVEPPVPNLADSPMESAQSYQAPNVLGTAQPSSPVLKAGDGANHGPQHADGQSPQGEGQDSMVPTSKEVGKASAQTPTGQAKSHWLKGAAKFVHWAAERIWHHFLSRGHRYCRETAKFLVSGRRSGSSRHSSGQGVLRRLAQGLVYLALLGVFYLLWIGLIARLVGFLYQPLGQWIDSIGLYLLKLFFIHLPFWLLVHALAIPWVALVLGTLLFLWIYKTFRPGLGLLVIAGGALFAFWWFRADWEKYLPAGISSPLNLFSTQKNEEAKNQSVGSSQSAVDSKTNTHQSTDTKPDMGTPVSTPIRVEISKQTRLKRGKTPNPPVSRSTDSTMESAQSNPRPQLGASAKTQTERHDLGAPISKEEMGTAPAASTASSYKPLHPWTLSDGMKSCLQAEIAALPPACLVSGYPPKTDEGMGTDRAGHLLSNLPNDAHYRLKAGHDIRKIQSLSADENGLTIQYPAGLSFGGVSVGGSAQSLDWRNLSYLHCNQAQVTVNGRAKVLCQLTLGVAGQNTPLIFQCATAENCDALVSALEAWARKGRDGKEISIGSMPYLGQGMALDSGGKVATLWEGGPAQEAGLVLGDYPWSLEQDSNNQKGLEAMEADLENLTPGPHGLYVVSSAEWYRAPKWIPRIPCSSPPMTPVSDTRADSIFLTRRPRALTGRWFPYLRFFKEIPLESFWTMVPTITTPSSTESFKRSS